MREIEKLICIWCVCVVCCGYCFGIMFVWIYIFINKDGFIMIWLVVIICIDDGLGVFVSISMMD